MCSKYNRTQMSTKINDVEDITTAFVLFCFGDPKSWNGGITPYHIRRNWLGLGFSCCLALRYCFLLQGVYFSVANQKVERQCTEIVSQGIKFLGCFRSMLETAYCRLADLHTCRLGDLQTCRPAYFWIFSTFRT